MDPARMLAGFPAPWTVVEATGEFIVKDATGRSLGHFYWWGDPRRFSHGTRRGAWRRNLLRRQSLWCGDAKASARAPTPPTRRSAAPRRPAIRTANVISARIGIASPASKDVEVTAMRIALQLFLQNQRQAAEAAPHVGVAGGEP
jgi:hypothetical protein